MNQLLQLSIGRIFEPSVTKDSFVKAAKSRDDCLCVLTNFMSIVNPHTDFFDCSCLLPQLLKLLFVHHVGVAGVEHFIKLCLFLSKLSLKLNKLLSDLVLLVEGSLVVF